MRKRKDHIPAREKLAAALLMCMGPDETGRLVRLIPHHEAVQLTAEQIISLFQFDHDPVREEDRGPAEAWNLTPRLIVPHRRKTAREATQRAKDRSIGRSNAAHAARMAAKLMPVEVRGAMGEAAGCREGCTMSRCAHSFDGRCVRVVTKGKRPWPKRPFPKRPKQPKSRRHV